MPTIQEIISHYSQKLLEQEAERFNVTVASVISNELRYMKKLVDRFYITLKPVPNIARNWTITILASSKPHNGSIETPLSAADMCKVLTEAGGKIVENTGESEYQFVFSLID